MRQAPLAAWKCVGAMALACALALGATGSARAEPNGEAAPLAALEQAFWACDYVGTTEGVAEAPVAFCLDVTRALEEQKFGGDFDAMVAWWRENKAIEHARLAAEGVGGLREIHGKRQRA